MHKATSTPSLLALLSKYCRNTEICILSFQFFIMWTSLHTVLFFSILLPEKLDYIASKFAEHTHEKWSSEKVGQCYNSSH